MSLFRTLTCLSITIICSQFPAFEAYYETRLQARIAEVHKQVHLFEQAASASQYSLEDYIVLFETQPQKPFQEGAKVMRQTVMRQSQLEKSWNQLLSAHYPYKALVWLQRIDLELVSDTWKHYQWALVLNKESLFFAAIGYLIGYLLFYALKISAKKIVQKVSKIS